MNGYVVIDNSKKTVHLQIDSADRATQQLEQHFRQSELKSSNEFESESEPNRMIDIALQTTKKKCGDAQVVLKKCIAQYK